MRAPKDLERRRVLVFGPVPPPIHGAARVTALVRDELRTRGARVITVDTGTDALQPWHNNIRVVLRMTLGLLRLTLAGGSRSSVYIAAGSGKMLWYQALVVGLARLRRARMVIHHHSFAYVVADSRPMDVLCRLGGDGLLHIALCEGMARQLRKRYPAITALQVCSNAALMEPGTPRDRAATGAVVLGHLSNLSTAKGLVEVLASFDVAREAGLATDLLLGGVILDPGDRALVDQSVARHGARVTWLGPVPADKVDDFYGRVHLALFPSGYRNEAEPLIVLEAARCSVPTMTTALGCLPGMAADPTWVIEHAPEFPAAVTERLRSGIFDGRAAGDAAREHFLSRRETGLQSYAALITHLLAGSPA